MKKMTFIFYAVLMFGAAKAISATDNGICGAKQVRDRWQFSNPFGWTLDKETSGAVDGYMYLPPGKKLQETDRALAIVVFTKSEAGGTFEGFVREAIRRYTVDYPGGPPAKIVNYKGDGRKEIRLYKLTPGPNLSYRPGYETQSHVEDQSCFILIYLSTRSASLQDSYEADLVSLVRSFRRR